jgi:hypothetical protein
MNETLKARLMQFLRGSVEIVFTDSTIVEGTLATVQDTYFEIEPEARTALAATFGQPKAMIVFYHALQSIRVR